MISLYLIILEYRYFVYVARDVGVVVTDSRMDALNALFVDRSETLSVEEVAELLNISRQNAYAWLRDGVVPGYKLGTTWRVIRDELKDTMCQGAND